MSHPLIKEAQDALAEYWSELAKRLDKTNKKKMKTYRLLIGPSDHIATTVQAKTCEEALEMIPADCFDAPWQLQERYRKRWWTRAKGNSPSSTFYSPEL